MCVLTTHGSRRAAAITGCSIIVIRFIVSRQMPSHPPGSAPHMSNSRSSSNDVNSKCVSMASTTP